MKQTIGIVAAWIGATVLAIVIAAAGIASVRSQVTEAPTALGSPNALAVTAAVAETTTVVGPTTLAPGTTLGREPAASSTTSTPSTSVPGSGSPSTTSPSSTSTTAPSAPTSKNYSTAGGSVTISIANPNVTFINAVPNAGWKVEVEDRGPEKVNVKFERNDESEDEIEFVARFEDGELRVTIEAD